MAAAVDIESEYYVAVVLDRAKGCPVVMVSREGGVEIEVVAKEKPDAIVKRWLHPHMGMLGFQCAQLVSALGFTDKAQAKAERLETGLAKATRIARETAQRSVAARALAKQLAEALRVTGKTLDIESYFHLHDQELTAQTTIALKLCNAAIAAYDAASGGG